MRLFEKIAGWLEGHWITPAYAGWLLGALAVFFFGAGTNTMVGWLYAMSGISVALLGIAAILPPRSLKGIRLYRYPIEPVSVGDQLTIAVEIENQNPQPKTLLQLQDLLPFVLGKPVKTAIESIPAFGKHKWLYYHPATKRGVYRWNTVVLRTGAPLGLFWCRRRRDLKATAIIYPTVLPLSYCPLIDEIGQKESQKFKSDRQGFQNATEGLTRALRPYRIGDPTRLIHWRSSARYGDLRVRELEVNTGGQEVVICLDSALHWNEDDFEKAVTAAASLYFYASRRHLQVRLWTANTGLLQGHHVVLEALAATYTGEENTHELPTDLPLIWLTQNSSSILTLPKGSRWILWQSSDQGLSQSIRANVNYPGITINSDKALEFQLQQHPNR